MTTRQRSPGLDRAVRAAGSPRHGGRIAGYERLGARRERHRLAVAAAAVLGCLLVAILFFAWEAHNAAGVTYSHWGFLGKPAGDDYDEGAYVVSAQLLLKGYHLFNPVFSAQPAFFLPSLAAFVAAIPDPRIAGHVYEAAFGLLAMAGVAWMAWTAYRPLAAPLACLLLAFSPGFVLYAHAVESEMPMLGLCAISVAAAQSYFLRQRRAWAILAGLLLFAGSEMKLLSAVMVVPLALLLLGGAWRGYRAGRAPRVLAADGAAFLAAVIVPALLVLALLSPGDQWSQVIAFHLQASKSVSWGDGASNVQALETFLGYDPGLLIVAAIGALVILINRRTAPATRYLILVYALWFASMLVFLWRYQPLVQHQFVPLLAPLAVLGAGLAGVPWALRIPLRGWRGTRGPRHDDHVSVASHNGASARTSHMPVLTSLALVALVVYAGVFLARTVQGDARMFTSTGSPSHDYVVALVKRETRTGDFVVCDDPTVLLDAGRLPPPELDDPSIVRVQSGYLTSATAERATSQDHVAAVVARRLRYINGALKGTILSYDLPGYMAWVARHYRRVPIPPSLTATQVYVEK